MKRLCLPMLIFFSFLLNACSAKPDIEKFEDFSSQLSQREVIAFTSDVCCEYPDKTHNFRLYYEGNAEGCYVKILEPELLSGITANFSSDGTRINYSELSIDTGNLDAYGLSPMTSLPCLAEIFKEGYAESSWQDDELYVYEVSLNEYLKAHIFFSPLNMLPIKAELISGDTVKAFCTIDNWLKIME